LWLVLCDENIGALVTKDKQQQQQIMEPDDGKDSTSSTDESSSSTTITKKRKNAPLASDLSEFAFEPRCKKTKCNAAPTLAELCQQAMVEAFCDGKSSDDGIRIFRSFAEHSAVKNTAEQPVILELLLKAVLEQKLEAQRQLATRTQQCNRMVELAKELNALMARDSNLDNIPQTYFLSCPSCDDDILPHVVDEMTDEIDGYRQALQNAARLAQGHMEHMLNMQRNCGWLA
jgi:hypothetical protein